MRSGKHCPWRTCSQWNSKYASNRSHSRTLRSWSPVGGDGSVRTFGVAQIDTLKPGANSKFEVELVGPVAGGAAYTVTASGRM